MFPENRFIQDRHEREVQWDKDPIETKPIPQKEEKSAVSLKSGKVLSEIEKTNTETYRLLPGGGSRQLDYQGLLSQKDLDRIEKNYPIYKEAEKKTGINWKLLAAVHYRESSLGQNPRAKGNEYQFSGANKNRVSGNLLEDTITAGKILQEKVKEAHMSPLEGDEFAGHKVQTALLGYNGRIYKSPEHSPYVMNQFDEEHQNMKIFLGKDAKPTWSMDHRLGAYTVIRELTKAFNA